MMNKKYLYVRHVGGSCVSFQNTCRNGRCSPPSKSKNSSKMSAAFAITSSVRSRQSTLHQKRYHGKTCSHSIHDQHMCGDLVPSCHNQCSSEPCLYCGFSFENRSQSHQEARLPSSLTGTLAGIQIDVLLGRLKVFIIGHMSVVSIETHRGRKS
jgi:hypothetical protein